MDNLKGWIICVLCIFSMYFTMQGVVCLDLSRGTELLILVALVGWVAFTSCYLMIKAKP